MKKISYKDLLCLVFFLGLLGSIILIWPRLKSQTEAPPKNTTHQDNLITVIKPVLKEENGAAIICAETEEITRSDEEFIYQYMRKFSWSNPPPLEKSQEILLRYNNILKNFEEGAERKYFQEIEPCKKFSISLTLYTSALPALKSFSLLEQGKINDALGYNLKIVRLGQKMTESTNSVVPMMRGWATQKQGYQMIVAMQEKGMIAEPVFSQTEKKDLIAKLREEHKRIIWWETTFRAETVDYVNLYQKKADYVINFFNWRPSQVKEWIGESLEISLSNVDLPCGSQLKSSRLDVGLNPRTTPWSYNAMGKMFYAMTAFEFNDLSYRRCDVEDLILQIQLPLFTVQ